MGSIVLAVNFSGWSFQSCGTSAYNGVLSSPPVFLAPSDSFFTATNFLFFP